MRSFLFIILFSGLYMIGHSFFLILYLKLFGLFRRPSAKLSESRIKKVSIVIPAYNEEEFIYDKLKNLLDCVQFLNLSYEVLIGSDGSIDNTCEVAKSFITNNQLCEWNVYELPNRGKCQTINRLVEKSDGEVIICTDADILMDETSLQEIVTSFEKDQRLGCLSSVPIFDKNYVKTQSLYWRHDLWLRDLESRQGMLIVITGWLYGFRKEFFKPIPPGVMADDLWIPLTILLQGCKCIHNPNAKAFSEKTDEEMEIRRRRRVFVGGMDVIRRLFPELLKKPILFFLVFSHKINRWLLPLWILFIIIAAVLLYENLAFVYGGGLLVLTICLSPKRLFYLVYAAFSPLLAIREVFTRKDFSKWEHTRGPKEKRIK